jgi:hypothetical protein
MHVRSFRLDVFTDSSLTRVRASNETPTHWDVSSMARVLRRRGGEAKRQGHQIQSGGRSRDGAREGGAGIREEERRDDTRMERDSRAGVSSIQLSCQKLIQTLS